jgi:hypothetical protein
MTSAEAVRLLILWPLVAIGVKQASYILMHGSIFTPLRDWIGNGMRRNWLGFEKLNELFTCKVCMSTQVSIWLVGLPLFLDYMASWSRISAIAMSSLVIFAVAGTAVWVWNLSEYRPQKFEAQQRHYTRIISSLRRKLSEAAPGQTFEPLGDHFTRELFHELLDQLDDRCRGIGCGYTRRGCRLLVQSQFFEQLVKENKLPQSFDIEMAMSALDDVLPGYFHSSERRTRNREALREFRDQFYTQLFEVA